MVSESAALEVLGLDLMKTELRIPLSETSHDTLLKSQIGSAVSYLQRTTNIEPADMPPALRSSAVALVRLAYDGVAGLPEDPTFEALMAPWQSFAG